MSISTSLQVRTFSPKINSASTDSSDDFFGESFDIEVEFQIIKTRTAFLENLQNKINTETAQFLKHIETKAKQNTAKVLDTKVFDSFWKFPVKKSGKEPACRWKDPKSQTKHKIPNDRFNTGIPTGDRNNLLVVDVDVKDEGVDEIKKFINQFGSIETLTVETPTGGLHYYFKYAHSDFKTEYLIKTYLRNTTKYRGKGIDIRSEGGYIVGPPSVRLGKSYSVIKAAPVAEMPLELVTWLIEEKPDNTPTQFRDKIEPAYKPKIKPLTRSENFEYEISDDKVWDILNRLPQNYLDDYSKWLVVTSALKRHNLHDIWDEWSRRSTHYDKTKNEKQWRANQGVFDINYLACLVKGNSEIKTVRKFKKYTAIETDTGSMTHKTFNKPYVSEGLDDKTFDDFETIIIKSCTGTGKTTAIAKHMLRTASVNKKFLSITTRTSLSDQHEISFEDIGMKNYQDLQANLYDEKSLTICLNSLLKLGALEDDDLEEYTVYIDEVSSLTEFTNNDLLDSILKQVVMMLCRLVRCAKKVIVSDALINDNTFELLKHRNLNKTVMLTNEFQKFAGVEAIRLRSEKEFLDTLVAKCQADEPFLFGCDSCNVVTAMFHFCMQNLSDQRLKDKMLLITAETKVRIKNANEEFKDKFVFYSPKITFGVDFSTSEAQDVFIYIDGNSIQPSGSFQQATRCRNIRRLYFHGECKEQPSQYNSVEDVKKQVETCLEVSKCFVSACTYLDEFDRVQVVRNTFFNLYCYNEYVRDIYATNKVKHFELILEQNGFKLSSRGTKEPIQIKDLSDELKETTFEEFLNTDDPKHHKFAQLRENIEYLQLDPTNKETLKQFRDIVLDKNRIKEHDAIIRVLKSAEHVDMKLNGLHFTSVDAKLLTNSWQKVKILRELEARYNLSMFENKPVQNFTGEFNEHFYNLIKFTFKTKRAKPTTEHELKIFYGNLVKLAGSRQLLSATKFGLTLNSALVQHHLDLNRFKNRSCTGFAGEVEDRFGVAPVGMEVDLFVAEGLDD